MLGWDIQGRSLGKGGDMRQDAGESDMEGLEGGKLTSFITWACLNPHYMPGTVLGATDML